MNHIEKTCENCRYEHEDLESTHCRHCVHNATENFEPKEICEWKPCEDGEYYLYPSCDNDFVFPRCDVESFRVCPYCSKKIKVVD